MKLRLVLLAVVVLSGCDALLPIRVDCLDVSDEECAEVSEYVERYFDRRGEVVHSLRIRPTRFAACGLHEAVDFDTPLYDVVVRLEGQSRREGLTLSRASLDPSVDADLTVCVSAS